MWTPRNSFRRAENVAPETPLETWQALESLWKTILGLEASIDNARLGMDGIRSEMETAYKKSLGVEEKLHGLQSDVAQWNKAKNRVHYALPKVKEFIHRATWSLAVPERKRLEEIVKNHIEPRVPLPELDRVREQLEHFQKDRQLLFAPGQRGLPGMSRDYRRDSAGPEHAPEECGRPGACETSAKREKGKFF